MTIYLLQYKNYYNRKVGRFDSVAEYYNNTTVLTEFTNINFTWADGLTTKLVINWDGAYPDYLIAEEVDGTLSRWYITESKYNARGQFELSLLRDVVADWQDKIFSAPCFVEKGYTNVYNSAIYNNENMTYNQILTSKTPLSDETKCPWIVGFIPKDYGTAEGQATKFTFDYAVGSQPDITVDGIANLSFYDQLGIDYRTKMVSANMTCAYKVANGAYDMAAAINVKPSTITPYDLSTTKVFVNTGYAGYGMATGTTLYSTYTYGGTANQARSDSVMINQILNKATPQAISIFLAAASEMPVTTQSVAAFVNKTVLDSATGRLYRVKAVTATQNSSTRTVSAGNLFNLLTDVFTGSVPVLGLTYTATGPFTVRYVFDRVRYELVEEMVHAEMDISDPIELYDSPYNIWCMPYSDTYEYVVDGVTYTSNKSMVFSCATAMSASLGDGVVYDVQLLPYCPIRERMDENGVIDDTGYNHIVIKNALSNAIFGYGFWLTSSSGAFSIEKAIEVPADAVEFKVANECDKYRLVSPTDGSGFDFTATKNNGVSSFNVSYTYKPFQSYIRVSPSFSGLYGYNSEYEKRGLILRGDFSLARISNAWANYKLNNVNYENIFNRQIESIEFQNNYQMASDIINSVTGAASTGVTTGLMTGNVYAGIAAAGASMVAGAADVTINKQLRDEALDLTKDQFGYQMGNIKALPNTITRVSAFDIDCSLFPMIEYYTATFEEKQALRDKLLWNGMTIMRIGTLDDYMAEPGKVNYIKGKIIQLNDLNEDSHIANAIANEINQGVYITE